MKKFKITAHLPNGDEVEAKVVASSEASAVARIKSTEQFREFIGDTPVEEVKFKCNGSEEIIPIAREDCELLAVFGGESAVEHKRSGAVVSFIDGHFNATAKILRNPQGVHADELATAMREVGEWLYVFHRDKVFDLRKITQVWMKKSGVTAVALAAEIGACKQSLGNYLHGSRALPYEQLERLLTILKQAGEL